MDVTRQLKVDALRFALRVLRFRLDLRTCWERAESDDYEIVYVLEDSQGNRRSAEVSEALRLTVDESGWSVADFRAVNGTCPIRDAYINRR